MVSHAETDWNPETYARFRDLRLRPALDLLAQVPALSEGPVVDLGCGAGAVGAALSQRFAGRALIGVDRSDAMLAEARNTGHYTTLTQADAGAWRAEAKPALIFSNAALHWLGDHAGLMVQLARQLAPGGTLAVQMPRQSSAPSHRFLRDFAAEMFPDRFGGDWQPPVAKMADYHRILGGMGALSLWETDYLQCLEPAVGAHPIRCFTEATVMRPYLAQLSADEAQALTARYEAALAHAYPAEPDGTVLFPFRRIFFTLTI